MPPLSTAWNDDDDVPIQLSARAVEEERMLIFARIPLSYLSRRGLTRKRGGGRRRALHPTFLCVSAFRRAQTVAFFPPPVSFGEPLFSPRASLPPSFPIPLACLAVTDKAEEGDGGR